MSQDRPLEIKLSTDFTQDHHDALLAYLRVEQYMDTAVWRQLFKAVDLLDKSLVITGELTRTFREVYKELIEMPFSNAYIEQLLDSKNVSTESPRLAARFARQIGPILENAGFLRRDVPYTLLLQGYCLYWWQSFTRGYAFEVFIMRDLTESNITFQMHDIRSNSARYSPADLIVLDLLGDVKNSTYFLQWQSQGQLPNDFYITRLYQNKREHAIVVFQKPFAWELLEGGPVISGTLETILDIFPSPVKIEQHGIILIVAEYELWKKMVYRKQLN